MIHWEQDSNLLDMEVYLWSHIRNKSHVHTDMLKESIKGTFILYRLSIFHVTSLNSKCSPWKFMTHILKSVHTPPVPHLVKVYSVGSRCWEWGFGWRPLPENCLIPGRIWCGYLRVQAPSAAWLSHNISHSEKQHHRKVSVGNKIQFMRKSTHQFTPKDDRKV